MEMLSQPWPWYVAGPLIGMVVPLLLWIGGKPFGVSSSFRDVCAAVLPGGLEFFRYDWKEHAWRLAFAMGIIAGGFVGGVLLASPDPVVAISEATRAELQTLGIHDFRGFVPSEFISGSGLLTGPGFVLVVVGGFLVGFGSRWAGGCTSGHAIMGLANLQLPSLIAVMGFFAGGLAGTFWVLPRILPGGGTP